MSRAPHTFDDFAIGIDVEDARRFTGEGGVADVATFSSVFTAQEHAHCITAHDGALAYAVHWCAKEAAVKALWSWMRLDPRRVSLVHGSDGVDSLLIDGEEPASAGVTALVSTSTAGGTACAVVLAGPTPGLDHGNRPPTNDGE